MTVLVAYASRHGSTEGIARRIAETLRTAGVAAEAKAIHDVRDAQSYDAFVVGSAAYMFHWMKEATSFVKRHRRLLAQHPVWLFSSGPLGTDLVDDEGRDVLEVSRPKEFQEFERMLHPRDMRVFFGAWDPEAPPVGMVERLVKSMAASENAMPAGDFRDWAAIEAWANAIASQLLTTELADPRSGETLSA